MRLGVLYALAGLLLPFSAQADQYDTFNLQAGVSRQHDSNFFRVADTTNLTGALGKNAHDEEITSTRVGLSFRKAWGLQEFEARAERVANRYANYDFLDHDASNANAAWRWRLTPLLSGNLTFNRQEAMVGFGNYYTNYGTLNMRTTTTRRFDADWEVFRNGWHLRAGADNTTSRNTTAFSADEGSRVNSADLALRYRFPSSSWLELISRTGRGTYFRPLSTPSQLDTEFDDRRTEARLHWVFSGKSTFDATAGRLKRTHRHFASRDYEDPVGSLKWTWMPTGKLSLITMVKRDLAAYTDNDSSYYRQDTLSLSPTWQVDARLRLFLSLDRNRRDYQGAVAPTQPTARKEQVDAARLVAEWQPLQSTTVSGYVTREQRAVNWQGLDYSTKIAGAELRLEF